MKLPKDVQAAREALQSKLKALVGDVDIPKLAEALTHTSYANEAEVPDNQRLEFLGDAVLQLCVSERLVIAHPRADEGELSRMRAALVSSEALAVWGRSLNLGACLAVGKGARAGGDREQTNVIADAVEAIIAATYDAHGLEAVRAIVADIVEVCGSDAGTLAMRDAKSALQELVQARGMPAPFYVVVGSRGPSHDPIFEVAVQVGDRELSRAEGRSKRLAERAAAAVALPVVEELPVVPRLRPSERPPP